MIPRPAKYFDYQYLSLSKFDENIGKFVVTSWLESNNHWLSIAHAHDAKLALQSKTERKISERKRIHQHLYPNPNLTLREKNFIGETGRKLAVHFREHDKVVLGKLPLRFTLQPLIQTPPLTT